MGLGIVAPRIAGTLYGSYACRDTLGQQPRGYSSIVCWYHSKIVSVPLVRIIQLAAKNDI